MSAMSLSVIGGVWVGMHSKAETFACTMDGPCMLAFSAESEWAA